MPDPDVSSNSLPIFDRLSEVLDAPAPSPAEPTPTPAAPTPSAEETPSPTAEDSMAGFLEQPTETPAAPAEPTPAADDTPPPGLTSKAAETWKTIKKENRELKAKYDEALKNQLSEEQKAKLSQYEEQTRQLQEKLSRYEKEMVGVKLEATEEYQNQVTRPLETVRSSVQDLADTYELDLEALNAAIVEDDRKARVRKLAQLGETMLEPDRLKLYKLAEDFDAVVDTKVKLEENAEKTLQEFEAQRAEASRKAAVQDIEQVQKATETLWPLMVKKAPILKDEKVAAAVRAEAASIDFSSARPDIKAYVALAGATLPKLVTALQKSDARVAELTAQIKAMTGAAPTSGAPGGQAGPANTASFLDAIEHSLR